MREKGTSDATLQMFVIEHMLESLLYQDTLLILNNLQSHKDDAPLLKDVKKMAKEYYDKLMISAKKINGIMLYNNKVKTPTMIVQNKTSSASTINDWHQAEKEDEEDLKSVLGKVVKNILPIQEKMGEYAGYMAIVKNQYYIFKVKHISKPRHKGARCDQSGKKEATLLLQNILVSASVDIDMSAFPQTLICVLQEFYLRLFNIQRKGGKRWFLSPIEVLIAI